jgi:predicted O-methyltransferase YrrM
VLTLPLISQEVIGAAAVDWTGLTKRFINPNELECIVSLLRQIEPRSMIEFGVNEGRTAKAIMRSLPSIKHYLGIDVPQGFVPAKQVQRAEVPKQPAHMVKGDPRFTLFLPRNGSQSLSAADLISADAVFIDGDHSYAGVMHDTMLARAVINPGGIIIWHDYHDLGTVDVREALHDLAALGESIWHIEGTWVAFQRIGNPPNRGRKAV